MSDEQTNEPTVLRYQLDLLAQELGMLTSTIRQMDEMGKTVKNWAMISWMASVGAFVAHAELREYLWLTALLPLMFWIVDAGFRRIQRRYIFRLGEISDFVNGEDLRSSVAEGHFVDFRVLDTDVGRKDRSGYREFVSIRRVAFFRTVAVIYLGLALCSAVLFFVVTN